MKKLRGIFETALRGLDRAHRLVSILAVMGSVLMLSACSSSSIGQVDHEGGRLYTSPSGSIYVAELQGTFHQMGRQYGLLLSNQLSEFYEVSVTEFLIGEKGIPYDDLAAAGRNYYIELPQIFKDYLDGMAETSGLTAVQTYIMAGSLVNIFEGGGCSSISAWGDYTTDGKVLTGRNLDLPTENLRRFNEYMHVVVWNPTGSPASVAHIDYIGGLFYQTAINSKGFFLELQNGQNADTSEVSGRQNTNNILLESLFRNTVDTDVDKWFETNLPECGLIMNGSFPDHATIYEWATFGVAPRNGDGLISASNDFVDPSWTSPPIHFFDESNEGFGYTWTRRTNLMALGEFNKGVINPQKMMEVMDTTIPDSGATFPEGGLIKTIYSVVAQPSELKLWLKVREYSGWEEIDLNRYFHD
jgi:hypothetical protein